MPWSPRTAIQSSAVSRLLAVPRRPQQALVDPHRVAIQRFCAWVGHQLTLMEVSRILYRIIGNEGPVHDLVIRDATVVDGAGTPGFVSDVAVDAELITEVGNGLAPGRETIDAEGRVLAPGWIDIHTHYDAQVLWDFDLAPSSWHGITTTILGNCGIGLAPALKSEEGRKSLARLIEGVEEISASVVNAIVDWSWESFPEFLNRLAGLELSMDVGAYIAHGPLRLYAMGERGADPDVVPTDEELDKFRRFTKEALEAGAFGFSTTRSVNHRTSSGDPAPSARAPEVELAAIAAGIRECGGGLIEALVDFDQVDEDFALLRNLSAMSGVPVTFPLVQRPWDPEAYLEILQLANDARREGASLHPQVAPRPVGVLLGLGTGRSPFRRSPLYCELESLPKAAQIERLRDPSVRETILREIDDEARGILGRVCELGDPTNYFPGTEDRLAARAERQGATAPELAYDIIVSSEGRDMMFLPSNNYYEGDTERGPDHVGRRDDRARPLRWWRSLLEDL